MKYRLKEINHLLSTDFIIQELITTFWFKKRWRDIKVKSIKYSKNNSSGKMYVYYPILKTNKEAIDFFKIYKANKKNKPIYYLGYKIEPIIIFGYCKKVSLNYTITKFNKLNHYSTIDYAKNIIDSYLDNNIEYSELK